MKNLFFCLVFTLSFTLNDTVLADQDSKTVRICGKGVTPILSVADFDGSGSVDQRDITLIKHAVKNKRYYAFYDLNTDGKINREDVALAEVDVGKTSGEEDQSLARLFHQVKQFQLVDSREELNAMGFSQGTGSLAGHGEHWTNRDGALSIIGWKPADFGKADGLNVPMDGNSVKGMFWGVAAQPVFENGATDYPTPGGQWETSPVVAFADMPPVFTGSPDEHWHTHAALCITTEAQADGLKYNLNQYMTYAECQTLPSVTKSIRGGNIWINVWMLHVWMFDLNPNGLYANTHPCVDPDAPSEDAINGGRPVPPFFQHHGG